MMNQRSKLFDEQDLADLRYILENEMTSREMAQAIGDLNRDGEINEDDLNVACSVLTSIVGDLNEDGRIDRNDLERCKEFLRDSGITKIRAAVKTVNKAIDEGAVSRFREVIGLLKQGGAF